MFPYRVVEKEEERENSAGFDILEKILKFYFAVDPGPDLAGLVGHSSGAPTVDSDDLIISIIFFVYLNILVLHYHLHFK